ncbi:hypothetical protein [Paraburkholderia terrae]|uniref:hypothetical protein n=1 Tax=Paraburkholderia terrae TaxID=311230 RepID=UPI00336534DC
MPNADAFERASAAPLTRFIRRRHWPLRCRNATRSPPATPDRLAAANPEPGSAIRRARVLNCAFDDRSGARHHLLLDSHLFVDGRIDRRARIVAKQRAARREVEDGDAVVGVDISDEPIGRILRQHSQHIDEVRVGGVRIE